MANCFVARVWKDTTTQEYLVTLKEDYARTFVEYKSLPEWGVIWEDLLSSDTFIDILDSLKFNEETVVVNENNLPISLEDETPYKFFIDSK